MKLYLQVDAKKDYKSLNKNCGYCLTRLLNCRHKAVVSHTYAILQKLFEAF